MCRSGAEDYGLGCVHPQLGPISCLRVACGRATGICAYTRDLTNRRPHSTLSWDDGLPATRTTPLVAGHPTLYKLLEERYTMCTGPHDFIPAENTARLKLEFDTPGGKALHVLHFRKSDPWTESDLRELTILASTNWDAQFSPIQSSAVELVRMVATDLTVEDSFEYDTAPSVSLVGGLASPPMPGNVTVASKFTTGFSGRSNRGRAYFIGLTEGQCAADALVAGQPAVITDAWIDFFGAIKADVLDAEHVIVSYCEEGDWRVDAKVTTVTGYQTDEVLDSMRSRLFGRGM